MKNLKGVYYRLKKNIKMPEDQFQELSIKAEAADLYLRMVKHKKNKNSRMKFGPNLRKFYSQRGTNM